MKIELFTFAAFASIFCVFGLDGWKFGVRGCPLLTSFSLCFLRGPGFPSSSVLWHFSPMLPSASKVGRGRAVNMVIPRPRGPVAFPQLGNLPMAFTETKPRILSFEEYVEFLTDLETDCVTWAKLGPSFQISQFVGPKAPNVPMECVQDLL